MMFALLRAAALLAIVASAEMPTEHLLLTNAGQPLSAPWQVAVKQGQPHVLSLREDGNDAICLDSTDSSFSIQRRTEVDLRRTPMLHVRWRVDALPPGADFRTSKDDQAAQFFVAFATPLRYRAINYIWDTNAPLGITGNYNLLWFIKIKTVVVHSGTSDVRRWIEIVRDVRHDYDVLFGGDAPDVKGIRFQVNSQHTHSHVRGCIADVFFVAE